MAKRGRPPRRDILGHTFGHLRVLRAGKGKKRGDGRTIRTWICQCTRDGVVVEVRQPDLTSGHTVSCGCIHAEAYATGTKRPLAAADRLDARVERLMESGDVVIAPTPQPTVRDRLRDASSMD